MPKQIIYFTKYARNGASSRLRSYQYIDLLEKEPNVKVTVQNLFSDLYIQKLYNNQSILLEAFLGYLNRFFMLFKIFKYDEIVIEKELFPYLPSYFEWIIAKLGKKYIVDYDDAIFHNYDRSNNKLIRFFLQNKIAKVIKYARVVIVGNEYLKSYALKAKAKKIELIPTVIDIDRYPNKVNTEKKDELIIGWIGTPKTIYLFQQNLKHFCLDNIKNIKIITIGGKLNNIKIPYEFIAWTEKTEVSSIKKIDIGIMPLLGSDFENGKCGYKLIQYMACGIPVIASAVGVNNEIVKEGVNGFLVHDPADWEKHINYFANNPSEISLLGQQARKIIMDKYTLQVQYPLIKKILNI